MPQGAEDNLLQALVCSLELATDGFHVHQSSAFVFRVMSFMSVNESLGVRGHYARDFPDSSISSH
jgi:hypothetical protein